MQVRSLGWEDPLEEEMATHSSILAWEILRREKPSGLQSIGSQRVGHNWSNWVWICVCVCACVCVYYSVQFTSVAQLCLILCDSMDCSMPGLLVHHQLPELIQTHVHRVSDAIQPSHPLSSPSPPDFNLSQHQGLFKRVTSSHQVATVL